MRRVDGPEGARDQADAVSDVGRHGDRARAHRCGAAGQAGRRAGRAAGARRRDEQHHAGRGHWKSAGVHVAYGLPGLKTHTKVALVVRREPDAIRRYVHIGTGNYNSKTARLYTDFGLFTCSPSIGADVSDLFNSLTGYSRQRLYRKLLVAPANMRSAPDRADRPRGGLSRGRGDTGRITAKMNAVVDPETIEALYRASRAGVEIDLIVRGICCLRPGVQGVSDRIRVISIIGRFLEHSRLWRFANGGTPEYYIGSADWMPRNFDRRVEAVVPVEDPTLHPRLDALLETCLSDNRGAWELRLEWHLPSAARRAPIPSGRRRSSGSATAGASVLQSPAPPAPT